MGNYHKRDKIYYGSVLNSLKTDCQPLRKFVMTVLCFHTVGGCVLAIHEGDYQNCLLRQRENWRGCVWT